jgi:hypothetical protein
MLHFISNNAEKLSDFGVNKKYVGQDQGQEAHLGQIQDSQKNLLSAWVVLYFKVHVMG